MYALPRLIQWISTQRYYINMGLWERAWEKGHTELGEGCLANAREALLVREIATMAAHLEGTQMMEEPRLPDSTDVTSPTKIWLGEHIEHRARWEGCIGCSKDKKVKCIHSIEVKNSAQMQKILLCYKEWHGNLAFKRNDIIVADKKCIEKHWILW